MIELYSFKKILSKPHKRAKNAIICKRLYICKKFTHQILRLHLYKSILRCSKLLKLNGYRVYLLIFAGQYDGISSTYLPFYSSSACRVKLSANATSNLKMSLLTVLYTDRLHIQYQLLLWCPIKYNPLLSFAAKWMQ